MVLASVIPGVITGACGVEHDVPVSTGHQRT